MSDDRSYPQASGPIALERATFEARFLAGRARLAFGPPGSWPRSPQLRMRMLAPVTFTQLPRGDHDQEPA